MKRDGFFPRFPQVMRRKKHVVGYGVPHDRARNGLSRFWLCKTRPTKDLVVFSGPCGAGKSTLANLEFSKRKHTVLLSRDRLRNLHPEFNDSDLTKAMIQFAARWLNAGKSCIIDACNLHEHDRIRWETVALVCGASLDWRTVSTALDVCIERDSSRQDPVGAARIREQFAVPVVHELVK